MRLSRAALLAVCLVPCCAARAADPFAENVRTTKALSTEAEARSFHLPPGFEIQLVASEPDIGKPFNIAFDAKGRLWATCSKEYPFPAKTGKGPMDRIMVLEDFDATGKARKISTFADNLNIPIGIYPYKDGCIAYSIPNISAYRDTEGAGKANQVEPLYGPYGFDRDTHGMTSNFRRGFDGWLYATHGFNNISNPKSLKTGLGITMHSGNTYRMKADGSAIEQFSWGQTNPFGFVFDPMGDAFASECEAKPVSLLIHGGYYEGLGKTHDGMGFAPNIINYMHGSTAIAGIFIYNDDVFPAEYRGNLFVGNVVTCRINRDSLAYNGSTPTGKLEADLLTTDDPWFRPVCMQLATDGSIFVADFYNRIIGHYEVPLTHPGRDHDHGRIWRIVYHGSDGKLPAAPALQDFSKMSAQELVASLGASNFAARMFAANELTDRIGPDAIEAVKQAIANPANAWQKVHGLWVLERLGALEPATLAAATKDPVVPVRVHTQRILAELGAWTPEQKQLAIAGLADSDALVQRCAADALSRHPAIDQIRPLLDLAKRAPAGDAMLLYAARVALREHLKQDGAFAHLTQEKMDSQDGALIDGVALAVPTEACGEFLARQLREGAVEAQNAAGCLKHAIRYAPAGEVESLATAGPQLAGDLDAQLSLFKSAQEGLGQRGAAPSGRFIEWAAKLAGGLLETKSTDPAKASQRRQAAAEIAGSFNLSALAPALLAIISDEQSDDATRIAAGKALMRLDRSAALNYLLTAANDRIAVREAMIQALGEVRDPQARSTAIALASTAPYRVQLRLAVALAGDAAGGELLLKSAQEGKLSARLLQEAGVRKRLAAARLQDLDALKDLDARIAAITKGLPPADQAVQTLIDQRRAAYSKSKPSIDQGAAVFAKNCAVCHTLEGQGGKVGPTLDGIGNRGLDRLCEDTLDPSRNVDPAFRYSTVTLKDGTLIDGLQRREEGAVLIFIDATGKEIPIPKDQIKARKETGLSLMPSNVGEIITPDDFNNLMAFLLSKNAAPKK